MPKQKALPKVSYRWTDNEGYHGRESKAVCKLCGAHFYGYSRNAIYPSTSAHKDRCPKVVEAKKERDEAYLASIRKPLIS